MIQTHELLIQPRALWSIKIKCIGSFIRFHISQRFIHFSMQWRLKNCCRNRWSENVLRIHARYMGTSGHISTRYIQRRISTTLTNLNRRIWMLPLSLWYITEYLSSYICWVQSTYGWSDIIKYFSCYYTFIFSIIWTSVKWKEILFIAGM